MGNMDIITIPLISTVLNLCPILTPDINIFAVISFPVFFLLKPSAPIVRVDTRIWAWGLFLAGSFSFFPSWMAAIAHKPCFTKLSETYSFTIWINSCAGSSFGREPINSRAVRASYLFFRLCQSPHTDFCRLWKSGGAFSGTKIPSGKGGFLLAGFGLPVVIITAVC